MFAVSSDSYKNIPARLLNGTGANNETVQDFWSSVSSLELRLRSMYLDFHKNVISLYNIFNFSSDKLTSKEYLQNRLKQYFNLNGSVVELE
ncbi:hypothetical protein T05_1144 [Trichinella murrelli]|uniref:Uncharacterized protein n=1 Tax=Trichinella murrelli TaxID=144512 RepID=A0A0V0TKK6_9BILA|nr:hypothetical protein T05_1144 [Trichinella murrelli]